MKKTRRRMIVTQARMVFLLVFTLFLTTNVLAEKIVFTEHKEDDSFERITKLMENYNKGLAAAINANQFVLVEPYLVKNSELYQAQKKLVKTLFDKGIKEKVNAVEVSRVDLTDDKYEVEVSESIAITYPGKPKVTKDFHWIYTAVKTKAGLGLTKIEKWMSYEKDMDDRAASVKADGYYAYALAEDYERTLESTINALDITDLKRISATPQILEKQKQLIIRLRKLGSDFKLKSSQHYDESEGRDGYFEQLTYKSKMVFEYRDMNRQKQTVVLNYLVKFDENRVGFGGYGIIVEMKELK